MRGRLISESKVRSAEISIVVTRADGRVENLGVVSYYSRNRLKHFIVNTWITLKEKYHGRSRSK